MSVKEILIYPIKSCYPVKLKSCPITETGFAYDRSFVVAKQTDDGWEMVSQRTLPRMTLIKPTIDAAIPWKDNVLLVDAPGMETLSIRGDGAENAIIKVWDDNVHGKNMGLEAAEWFSKFLGEPVSLFRKDSNIVRHLPKKHSPSPSLYSFAPQTGFADGFPVHLVNEQSLADVQSKLEEKNDATLISILNFRPNIVVDLEKWDEDEWMVVKIGEIVFYANILCTRCTLPSNNPETGVMGKEPTKVLQSFRRVDPGAKFKSCFGILLSNTRLGIISVGDEIQVLERGNHDRRGIWNHGTAPQKITLSNE